MTMKHLTAEDLYRRVKRVRELAERTIDQYPEGTVVATTDGAVIPLDVAGLGELLRDLDELERDLQSETVAA